MDLFLKAPKQENMELLWYFTRNSKLWRCYGNR